MGISDIRNKYRQLVKKPAAKAAQEAPRKIGVVITDMKIENETLSVGGLLPAPRTAEQITMDYVICGRTSPVSLRPDAAALSDDLLQIPFSADIPFPEEVEKVIFRVSIDEAADRPVEMSFEDKQDARAAEGDCCAWASKPDIICEPNIGDHRQAVAVHKLRRMIMGQEDRLNMLRVPADRSKAFAMLEENADRLLALLQSVEAAEITEEMQLGIISYLNAAMKKSVDFGKEYKWDATDYSARWEKIRRLLGYVDDSRILELKKTSRFVKIFFMELKHPEGCRFAEDGLDLNILYGDARLYPLSDFDTVVFFIKPNQERLIIEGAFHLPVCVDFEDFYPFALVNDTKITMEVIDDMEDRCRFDRVYLKEVGFRLDIQKPDAQVVIRFGYHTDGQMVIAKKLKYDDLLCPVSDDTAFGYMYENGLLTDAMTQMILCRPCDWPESISEREALLRVEALSDYALSDEAVNESMFVRDFYRLCRYGHEADVYEEMMDLLGKISRSQASGNRDDIALVQELIERYASKEAEGCGKKVWLVMDRPDRADDNGEAFFRYLTREKPENIDAYFVLQAEASGAADIRKAGPVVEPMSLGHRMLHVIAQFVLSSQTAEFVLNPFGDQVKYVRDLCRKPGVVFLQHGVTYNHFGRLISRYGRDYRGIVTNGQDEYDYFMSDSFHYTEDEIWLTGFPRFDRLYDDNRRVITIMPTWRRWLTYRGFDPEINMVSWLLRNDFESSEYFRFYEDLLSDRRLLEAADRYGYQIAMLPHVMFMKEGNRFKHPDKVTVYEYEVPYRKVFAESALVVTDYTSAVFDFAYLHKPVVYCQFDKDAFYTRHSVKKGYFDFERDGFGEVTYDKDSCIDIIIDYMKNDCRLKDEYRERVDRFFTYTDDHCCERLLSKLIEAGKGHAV